MAEERSQLPGAISKGSKLWDFWQGYNAAEAMAAGGLSQGMPYPGAISGPVPEAFAGGLSAISAAPFMALAGYNLSKIIGSALADKPKISFSGTDPKIGYNGNFGTYHESQYKASPGGSKKYNYRIGVEDTGRDGEIGQALVNYFDSIFDQMAAQGIPVNEMLDRNKDFIFGGRHDKGTGPEGLMRDIMTHFQPDITAYQSGQRPPERQITVKASNIGAGRDGYEMGKTKQDYTYTIGGGGLPTQSNTSGGDTMTESPVRDLYRELFNRPQPDQGGLDFWEGLWDTGNYTEDQMRDAMREAGRQWTKSPGGTQWIHNTTGESAPDFDGVPVAPGATIPDNIPANLQPGLEGFVNDSWDITRQYRETADQLWSDYLDFEKAYFNKFEDNQQQYQNNLSSMPQVNLKMPGTMGGATVPLAPKVHSAMYTDQFNAINTGIGNQANASLAGLGSRDALAKNIFATNLNNLQNSFLPTQVGLDLYNLERAGALGIDRAEAGKYEPSGMSIWAPVVGSLLQSDFGSSATEGLWDAGSELVKSGWDAVTGFFG